MTAGGTNDDREAVLETVRAFYTDPEAGNEFTAGPLHEWGVLIAEASEAGTERFQHTRELESAELIELSETHAVVEVRAAQGGALVRGSWEYEIRLDGPTVLEQRDGVWRIVDLTQDGRRRLASIVRGPLAEQQRPEATVRILGVDRCTQTTQYAVELVNTGEEELTVDRAWALFETETAWSRLGLLANRPVPPGESGTVLLHAGSAVELTDPVLGIALRIRAGKRRLPFLLKVPLTKPEEVVPQKPPRYLPLLRSTWPRSLVFYAALTIASAYWLAELAVIIPLTVAGLVYVQIRTRDALPERLYRFRFLLDALVAAAAFLVLWETATALAVPAAIAALVYFALWRFARRRRQLRLVVALVVGCAWLFLLGTYTSPLSPCRIADGTPASAADDFAREVLTRDPDRVREAIADGTPSFDGRLFGPRFTVEQAEEIVSHRKATSDGGLCRQLEDFEQVTGCYEYHSRIKGKRRTYIAVVSCSGSSWDTDRWFTS